ncbi:MAG TPA: carboxypeptidase regulatory-like domain-containing protein, partial [Pyrinomonadaceae bacterium]
MKSFYRQGYRILMAAACSLAVMSSASNALTAQNQGSLRGRVMDQLGGLVVGAAVKLVAGSGEEKTVVTDREGGYVIPGLAPGKYTVRASAAGFADYEQTEVAVAGGRAETLDIKLSVKEVTGDVTVETGNAGRLGTGTEESASTLVLRGSELDILPDDPEQMAADLRMLGGPSEGPDGTQILVDGFSGSRIPPKSSIREVRISSDPYSASQDFYGFGRVEIITKPGSSKFNGSAFFNYNDRNLNARNPVAVSDTPYLMRFYGGNVSGPLFGKRGSFFLDVNRRDVDESLPINALTLDAALNVVPFDEVFPIELRRTGYSGRFDYQLSKDNTLVSRYEYSRTGYTGGLGDLSLPSRSFPVRLSDHTLQLTETAILSPSALNDTRFQFRRVNAAREGRSDEATINVQGAFVGGGPQVGDESNRTDSYDLTNTTTWTRGTHTWRAGGRLRYSAIDDISATNFGGTFVFSSLDQYRDVLLGVAGARPVQFTLAAGSPEAR